MKCFFFFAAFLFLASCTPEDGADLLPVQHPRMRYTNLQNVTVRFREYQGFDLNGDGDVDFAFSTILVGDPISQTDRLEFYAKSKIKTRLLNNNNDQSPILVKGNDILLHHPGYTWYEISNVMLVQKVMSATPPPVWQGLWKDANHWFLPVQVDKDGELYMGWIELSFNKTTEKLILHQAAICTEPGKEIKAGY